jgi:hypothetical protein
VSTVKALWRLATIKIVLFSLSSLWICWATATSNLDMPKLGWWDWFQTIGGCLAAWCLTMMAFVDRTASQISTGQIPGLELDKHKPEQTDSP